MENMPRPYRERIASSKIGLAANALMLVTFSGALAWVWADLPELVSMTLGISETEAPRNVPKWFYVSWTWMIASGGLIPIVFDGMRGRGILPVRMWATNLTVFAFSAAWFSLAVSSLYHDVRGVYLTEPLWTGILFVVWLIVLSGGMLLEERRRARQEVDAILNA